MEMNVEKNILEVTNLCKSFKSEWFGKEIEVLKNVSFSVPKGAIVGFLGANGAGKTTTIKCLLRLIYSNSGEVKFFSSKKWSPEIRSKIGFLPERPYFYEYLTGQEFLKFHGELSGKLDKSELNRKMDEIFEQVGLSFAKDRMLRGYSKGMLQRIGIAQALLHDPEFVILDEPMGGLDPDGRLEIGKIIREISAKGTTVFFSSHLLYDVEQLCNYLVILKSGEMIYQGKASNFVGSLTRKTIIEYLNSNDDLVRVSCLSDEETNSKIDVIRKNNYRILSIKNDKQSLEKAFTLFTADKKKDSGQGKKI